MNFVSQNQTSKVKLRVNDLKPGMFISDLDRPWLESPFLLQGFLINSYEDIRVVREHCDYVYVDLLRSTVEELKNSEWVMDTLLEMETCHPSPQIESAAETQRLTSRLVKSFLDEVSLGQSPDIQLAHSAAVATVSNLIKNPDAVILMARLGAQTGNPGQQAFNVCAYSVVIGKLLGLNSKKLENLGTCALLHDLGLAKIPEAIVNKPGELDFAERAIVETHATCGRDILISGLKVFSGAVDVAHAHHENLDGSGYPRQLAHHQIGLYSRIVAVADKYDSIVTTMPYRPAGDHFDAVSILNKLAKAHKVDSAITRKFISHLGVYPPGCMVELTSGELALVIKANPYQPLKPIVLVMWSREMIPLRYQVDLAEESLDENGKPLAVARVRNTYEFEGLQEADHFKQVVDTLQP